MAVGRPHRARAGRSQGVGALTLPPGLTRAKLRKFVRERAWYQSYHFLAPFGVAALSDSEAKWRALALPPLAGKTVLDLGCNAGYLTFRAVEDGALVAVGVDHDLESIHTAVAIRERIKLEPRAIFVHAPIEQFLNEALSSFDVVLGASVGHYLNLPMLLRRLANGAASLVALELPYVPDSDSFHVSRRGEILIPGERALGRIAGAYGFRVRLVGPSERLDEDDRAVFHFESLNPAEPGRLLQESKARERPGPGRRPARARAKRR
jgi:SAM-dependent methyltransferase